MVEYGGVFFVADRAYHRNARCKCSICDDAFIEAPQVLARAAAACDEHDINAERLMIRGNKTHRGRDICCSALALHAYIEDDELVEVTPTAIRIRKRYLDPHERKRHEKRSAEVDAA